MTDTDVPRGGDAAQAVPGGAQTNPGSAQSVPGSAQTNPGDLDARYGRTARHRRTDKRVLWGLASVIVIVFTAWVVLYGLDGTGGTLETNDIAHTIIDEHSVEVQFSLNVAPGTTSYCAVQALNEDYAVVGWKVIEVPPSEQRTRLLTETVITTEQSNTGLIYRCWLT